MERISELYEFIDIIGGGKQSSKTKRKASLLIRLRFSKAFRGLVCKPMKIHILRKKAIFIFAE